MRVVSAHGEVDVPYGAVILSLTGRRITAEAISGRTYLLAELPDSEKARLEMARIHEAYLTKRKMYQIDYDGPVMKPVRDHLKPGGIV